MCIRDRNKGAVWIGTRKDKVWQATDRDMDNVADTVESYSAALKFDIPNGVCYSDDGHLYVVERNRVLWFPAAEFFMEGADGPVFALIAQGELIPPEEESYNHTARVCVIGPDNKLYISMGQPFNVPPEDKYPMYDEVGIGGMIKINRFPGELGREVVGIGIRNSVGHAFNPNNGDLWFTDNQVDGMGDETPPGEINKACGLGPDVWYGFPYYGGGSVRTGEYKDKQIPGKYKSKYCKPQVETIAHAADLGMMFYTGDMFPAKYKNAIFSAQHGSWNAVKPRGAQVMVTFLNSKGDAEKTSDIKDMVYGVLFSINDEQVGVLDKFEGLNYGYGRKAVNVIDEKSSKQIPALMYYATDIDPTLKPYDWYKEQTLKGAKDNGLPEEYAKSLESFESKEDKNEVRSEREKKHLE